MNVLITGGTGFLGSKLAEKFISKGHNVTILDIRTANSNYRKKIIKNSKFIKANIASASSLNKVKVNKNSVLLHCAGQPSAALSFKNPIKDLNKILTKIKKNQGPILILIKIKNSKKISKRVEYEPEQIKSRFMKSLEEHN